MKNIYIKPSKPSLFHTNPHFDIVVCKCCICLYSKFCFYRYGAYLETFPDVETKPREPQEEVQEPADFSEIVAKKWTKKKTVSDFVNVQPFTCTNKYCFQYS